MSSASVQPKTISGSGSHGADKEKKRKLDRVDREHLQKAKKYDRGAGVSVKDVTDKKLKTNIVQSERRIAVAKMKAARAEILLPEVAGFLEAEGLERTYHAKQDMIKENVAVGSAVKSFELTLDKFGPYKMRYSRNGKFAIIAGQKGHVATFDWKAGTLGCELHLRETARDVIYLHNETMFAVAQHKYVHIYDQTGTELHCMRKHAHVNRLEFLPYHFLLASIGESGWLRYQDTSTGRLVVEHKTRLGPCDTMVQNPYNAVLLLGHNGGTVTMWTPNMTTPVVKMLCHKGPVNAIAVDRSGLYMATAGGDGQLKVYDVRTYKPLQEYYTMSPVTSLDISQRGLIASGHGPHVTIWKDAFTTKQEAPYMAQLYGGRRVESVRFCAFEDVLGVGTSHGVSSMLVPGAGEPNFDTFEANPFETKKQRQEREIKQLLEKVQPEMITLDPNTSVGRVARKHEEKVILDRQTAAGASKEKFEPKHKARGRSSTLRRYLRKQINVVDQTRAAVIEKIRVEKETAAKTARGEVDDLSKPKSALDRFKR